MSFTDVQQDNLDPIITTHTHTHTSLSGVPLNSSSPHLSEMKLVGFLRLDEICLLILNQAVSAGRLNKINVDRIYLHVRRRL